MTLRRVNTGLFDCTGVEGVPDWRAFVPARQSDGAVGYDVRACRVLDKDSRQVIGDFPYAIEPGGFALFGIGVIMAIPQGILCLVNPRSGLATKHHVVLANGPGTVDPDYRGEIACSMYNISGEPFVVNRGDRIAQLVFAPIVLPQFRYVDSVDKLPVTTRADGGFGSTGISGDGFGTAGYDLALRQLDIYFMEVVLATSRLSDCVRGCELDLDGRAKRDDRGQLIGQTRRLGCVFARGHNSVATGFNAQHPGADSCAEVGCLRDARGIESGTRLEVCRAIHAEQMAITNAANEGSSLKGCTMYCNAEPCLNCAKELTNIELEAVVILEGGYSNTEGLDLVMSAGIPVRTVKREWLYTGG